MKITEMSIDGLIKLEREIRKELSRRTIRVVDSEDLKDSLQYIDRKNDYFNETTGERFSGKAGSD